MLLLFYFIFFKFVFGHKVHWYYLKSKPLIFINQISLFFLWPGKTEILFKKYPFLIFTGFTGCCHSSELLLRVPQDLSTHLSTLGIGMGKSYRPHKFLIVYPWYMVCGLKGTSSPLCSTLFLAISNYGAEIFIDCFCFLYMLLIVSFPSRKYSLSSLMTYLLYLRSASVKEVKIFPLAPTFISRRSAIELSAVSQNEKKKTK